MCSRCPPLWHTDARQLWMMATLTWSQQTLVFSCLSLDCGVLVTRQLWEGANEQQEGHPCHPTPREPARSSVNTCTTLHLREQQALHAGPHVPETRHSRSW